MCGAAQQPLSQGRILTTVPAAPNIGSEKERKMLRKIAIVTALAGALMFPTASFAHGWGGHGGWGGGWHGGHHGWHGHWGWGGGGRWWGGSWYPYGTGSCWRPGYGGWVWVCG
jgi:hypothetical protein